MSTVLPETAQTIQAQTDAFPINAAPDAAVLSLLEGSAPIKEGVRTLLASIQEVFPGVPVRLEASFDPDDGQETVTLVIESGEQFAEAYALLCRSEDSFKKAVSTEVWDHVAIIVE